MKQTIFMTTLVTLLLVGLAGVPQALPAQEHPGALEPSCKLGAVPKKPEEHREFSRQYERAQEWIKVQSSSSLPQAYDELIQYTVPARLAIFSALSPGQISRFWVAHLERYLYGPHVFTSEQIDLLQEALELVANADIYQGNSDNPDWRSKYEPRVLELAVKVEEQFDLKMLSQIFVRPEGHISPGIKPSLPNKQESYIPVCNCMFWCDAPGASCLYDLSPHTCRIVRNCGFLNLFECIGVCGIPY